jgi:hypothetical protein
MLFCSECAFYPTKSEMPMLIVFIRVVLALILTAATPYALTVATVAVMWLDENFGAIFRKNQATRWSRAVPFTAYAIVAGNTMEIPGRTGVRRGFLAMEWVKMFDANDSKSASRQELYRAAPVETGREKLTNPAGAVEATIMGPGRELIMIEDGRQERATTMEAAAEQLLRIKTDILGRPSPKLDSRRKPQPDVIEKVRCVESIHHWHR